MVVGLALSIGAGWPAKAGGQVRDGGVVLWVTTLGEVTAVSGVTTGDAGTGLTGVTTVCPATGGGTVCVTKVCEVPRGVLFTISTSGAIGVPAGAMPLRPQWKMRVATARTRLPGAGAGMPSIGCPVAALSTIVIVSPVSSACTW